MWCVCVGVGVCEHACGGVSMGGEVGVSGVCGYVGLWVSGWGCVHMMCMSACGGAVGMEVCGMCLGCSFVRAHTSLRSLVPITSHCNFPFSLFPL